MVNDKEVPETAHPLSIDHLACRDRTYWLAPRRADEHALRLHPRRSSWSAKTLGQFPPHRQAQLPAQGGKRIFCKSGIGARERGDDAREARLVGAQHADFLTVLADIGGEALDHAAAHAALLEDFVTVGAARLLDGAQALGASRRLGGEPLELGGRRALLGEKRGRGARDVAEVVQS